MQLNKINLNQIALFFKNNKSNVLFVLLKYLDFGVIALIYLSLAKIVGPEEYGKAAKGFLTITYSGLVVAGLAPLMVKKYAQSKNDMERDFFLFFQTIFTLSAALLLLLSINFFFTFSYRSVVALICALKIIQEGIITLHRVKERIYLINIISLSFSIIFCVFFGIFPTTIYSFFSYWLYALLISTTVSFFTAKNDFTHLVNNISTFIHTTTKSFIPLFNELLHLGLLSILNLMMLVSDRFILDKYVDKQALGNFQLADNLANFINIGLGAISYLTTYKLLQLLYDKKIAPQLLIKKSYVICLALIIVIQLLLPVSFPIIQLIFPNYTELSTLFPLITLNKCLDMIFTFPILLFIAASLEKTYNTILFVMVLLNCIILIAVGHFNPFHYNLTYSFPIIQAALKFFFLMLFFIFIKKNDTIFIV